MKPAVMLELLEAAAAELEIKVTYEPLQTAIAGGAMRGGLCKVKGAEGMTWRVIVDKRATDEERVATLAGALAKFDTTELELSPKVRELLALYASGPRRAA
ncbi:MAG TPA: hypothetical protein VH143_16865 [Kofleriaceae bacterium]|nr:hypothetical protein [Kofleriaceae bacterium]